MESIPYYFSLALCHFFVFVFCGAIEYLLVVLFVRKISDHNFNFAFSERKVMNIMRGEKRKSLRLVTAPT